MLGVLLLVGCAHAGPFIGYRVGSEEVQALLCRPQGPGPFPAVVYNHGSVVDGHGYTGARQVGYDMDGTCEALAKEGVLALLPIREPTPRGKGFMRYEERYRDVAAAAVDYVKTRPDVDPSRIALMGFSMGGLTSLLVAVERSDLKAVLLLAPAWGRGRFPEAVERVPSLNAPVLLLVEASDDPPILRGVELLERALKTHGKEARVIRYNRGGGHRLFYRVDYYWEDVRAFLREKLR